ncbi:MAG: tetratricopeptide repeat protein [Chitinophagaceae bacterium]
MAFSIIRRLLPAKMHLPALLFLFCSTMAAAQKSKADSLNKLLVTEKKDSNRVRLMWQMADCISIYNPDSALRLSQKTVYLAKEINYAAGQSKALGAMANAFFRIGNYPRALELYFQKLQLEEQRNKPRDLASVLMNIGVVYTMQEEYNNSLEYYYKADTVIQQHRVADMRYYILLNLGDVYNRLNNSDSSYRYFNKSLELASALNDTDLVATARTGLGHSYLKMHNYNESFINYQAAIAGLEAVNDDEILCEATLGMAGLYQQLNKNDSAIWYATLSQSIAKKDGFLSHELEATDFLTNHYKKTKNIDSAFVYVSHLQELNDSINSKSRIRESQILSTNEQLRQLEIEENKKMAAKERFQQLQLLFIGIFIPGFFLFTLLLSRIKIHIRIIKILGILSLLIFFEYLTLLLHPYVLEITHHTPVYEIFIFVAIAALLIPAHHRLEHWLIEKLTRNKTGQPDAGIRLNTKKIKIKRSSA